MNTFSGFIEWSISGLRSFHCLSAPIRGGSASGLVMRRTCAAALLGWVVLVISGCFGIGLPSTYTEPPKRLGPPGATREGFDRHLVVLRLPVGIEPKDAPKITSLFVDGYYVSGQCSRYPIGEREYSCAQPHDTALSSSIAKTAYFGAQFYKLLKTALPDTDVVIQPTLFGMSNESTVLARGIVELPPSTIVIDFMAYEDPLLAPDDVWTLCDTKWAFLCPLVSIRTHPTASPATNGGLAGPEKLTWFLAKGQSLANDAASGDGATITELLSVSEQTYREYQKRPKPLAKAVLQKGRPLTPNKYVEFPYNRVFSDLKYARNQAEFFGRNNSLGPFVFAVVDAVDAITPKLGVGDGVAYYASFYDVALASRIKGGTIQDSDQPLYRLLGKFRDAEVKFLTAQDTALVQNLTTGFFAKAIGKQQEAEEQAVEQKHAANAAERASEMALLSAVSSNLAAADAARSHDISHMTNASNQALSSLNQYQAYKSQGEQLKSMNAGFAEAYATVIEKQYDVVLHLAGDEEAVRAGSLAELREKFKAIYKRVKQTL